MGAGVQHYDAALKLNPNDKDAEFNRELVTRKLEELKQQQQEEQKKIAAALATAGFTLSWQASTTIEFRELQADPLAGAVAA